MSIRAKVSGASLLVMLGAAGCGGAEPASGGSVQQGPTVGPPSVGGDPVIASRPLFEGAVVRAEHAAPVVGGTLLVTRDGDTIAVADPDRDALFLVDARSHTVRTVLLERGDEPGRVAEGPAGTLYVALRRAGALLAVDVARGTVGARVPVCAAPRGLAYDPKAAVVHVACRSGQLVTLGSADLARKRTVQLDTDLRDVIVREQGLLVTRFLSSELLLVAEDGQVQKRATPSPQPGCGEATVAFRALSLSNGMVAVGHQASSNDVISGGSAGYGFSCGGSLVSRILSLVDVDTPDPGSAQPAGAPLPPGSPAVRPASTMTISSGPLPAAGPLDIAFDGPSQRFAAIALDDSLVADSPFKQSESGPNPAATLWVSTWDGTHLPSFTFQTSDTRAITIKGQPVAVAFDHAGKYLVQSREPATLEFEDGSSVELSRESHADTGALMFHMNSGIGISCSSCHPEGGEDGHVWHFNEGFRRSMPLDGGVMARAPFHWDGTLGDMSQLVNEVMLKRMALSRLPSSAQIAALGGYLDQLPNVPSVDGLDAAAVKRGEALFNRSDVACASCHSGPQFTNNQLVDVGTGGMFVTPTLLGVGVRPALFHDGCAKSINQRFGPCGGTDHGKPERLSVDERADLVEFLRSL